jgi:hypothetical protein
MAFSTINKSTDYMNTVLYTGNGGTQSITGVGFQPDFTWLKKRNATANNNVFDAVRGSDKRLITNDTGVEVTQSNFITSFNSDGFSIGDDAVINSNTNTFASWNWKANGAGSANTDGTINSTVSVNTTAGFSIVKWTGNGSAGATVGHGLGAVPKMIIMKNLTESSRHWQIYHEGIGNAYYFEFDTTSRLDDAGAFNDTSPTSSVFTLGSSNRGNENTKSFIAYCFADVTGFSKMGKYIGNGNANGTFCFTGIKPAFVMIKNLASGEGWIIHDNKRNGYNMDNDFLYANTNGAEVSSEHIEILSNGFKARSTNGVVNGSGAIYIYMCFGQPIISNSGVCATAR